MLKYDIFFQYASTLNFKSVFKCLLLKTSCVVWNYILL